MSYCVNCGVELDKSAKKCALCSAPVINLLELGHNFEIPAPYPDKVVLPPGVRRRYIAFLLSMGILIPNIVCGIVNILFPATGHWAIYVISSSVLFWVLFVQPLLWKKIFLYSQVVLDTIATGLYTYIFYAVGNEKGWFYNLAVPFILMAAGILAFMIYWLKHKKRDWPFIIIALLIELIIASTAADILFNLYFNQRAGIGVSMIISVSCIALIVFFVYVSKNKHFREWLTRKFFY